MECIMKYKILGLLFLITLKIYPQGIEHQWSDILIGGKVRLNDFVLEHNSENYWNVYAKLTSETSQYFEYVKLKFSMYKEGVLVKYVYNYLDLDTYGSNGLIPNTSGFISGLLEKIDFDSIYFSIEHSDSDGEHFHKVFDALTILSTNFNPLSYSDIYFDWIGELRNETLSAIKYPMIWACFYNKGRLVKLVKTYLDVNNNEILAQTTGQFSTLVTKPEEYDSLTFLPHYSIPLTGEIQLNTAVSQLRNNTDFQLYQNYPNPFNASTAIKFDIAKPDYVSLTIHDITGRKVKTITNGFHVSGKHIIMVNMSAFASGTYVYRLKTGAGIIVKTMTLSK